MEINSVMVFFMKDQPLSLNACMISIMTAYLFVLLSGKE